MFSGARFSIQGLAAWAGAASRANARAESASRRMTAKLSAKRVAGGIHVGVRAQSGDLPVLDPDDYRGVLLHVDPACRSAAREPDPDDQRVPGLLDLERLEAHVLDQPLEAGEVAAGAAGGPPRGRPPRA